jgi:signal transduction histidine kinase
MCVVSVYIAGANAYYGEVNRYKICIQPSNFYGNLYIISIVIQSMVLKILYILWLLLCGSGVLAQSDTPLAFWKKKLQQTDSLAAISVGAADRYLDSIKKLLPQQNDIRHTWYEKKLALVFENKPYVEAAPYLNEWLLFSRQTGDSNNVAFCMGRIGHIYFVKKQYAKALEHELYALNLARTLPTFEASRLAGIYASLTNLYLELDYFEKARVFADSCLQIRLREVKKPLALTQAYALLGESHLGLGDTLAAIRSFESGLQLQPNGYSWLLHKGLGEVGLYSKAPQRALEHFQKAIDLFGTGQRVKVRPIPLLELKRQKAEAQYLLNDHQRSIATLQEALSNMDTAQLPVAARYQINGLLAKNYLATGQYLLSASYFNQYQAVADSVTHEEIAYLNSASARIRQERNLLIGGTILLAGLLAGIVWLLRQRKLHLLQLENRHRQTENLLLEKTNLIKQLEDTQAHLVQQEKLASLGELTAGIAHELNNPINFISTNAYALEAGLAEWAQLQPPTDSSSQPPQAEEFTALIAGIRRGCERSTDIINGLRLFARKGSSDMTAADLHAGIDICLLILNNKTKGVIAINYSKQPIPPVHCNLEMINQVLMNLLSNAVDELLESKPKDACISIGTETVGELVRVSIADNGRGIAPEVLPRIFEPFFTTKPAGKGTGLGLAISHNIVHQHGGQLTAANRAMGGCMFTITLPIHRRAQKTS